MPIGTPRTARRRVHDAPPMETKVERANQLGLRQASWHPPQLRPTSDIAALKLSRSFVLAAAAFASAPNFAAAASNSFFFSQMTGNARVSPVLEFGEQTGKLRRRVFEARED